MSYLSTRLCGLLVFFSGVVRQCQASTTTSQLGNNTVDNARLHTWWHNSGEINTQTQVRPENVRQSHLYSIQVASTEDQVYYDSFVYQTIPRNGQGEIVIPDDPTSTTTAGDGITIEAAIGMTMSWTSFLFTEDVLVKVHRLDGVKIENDGFVIRPSNLNFTTATADGDLVILVPYSARGSKFSVEFDDNLYDFHDGCNQPTCSYVQDVNSSGPYYVNEYTDTIPIMSTEPLDSLLIFASPFEDVSLIPDETSSDTLVPTDGRLSNLNVTDAKTIFFKPGVYYATSTDYLNLSSSVEWLYFAPGAYVKGAVEFHTSASLIRASGHGVLSGEQYVYQADPTYNFWNHNVDASPLRMFKGTIPDGQQTTWIINGPTVNSPPFNSMDFYGDTSAFSVLCTDYKQVGAFFGQTDGMQMYPGSVFQDIFYHTNDDSIKVYHSGVTADNIVVYKGSTAPVIQFGWAPRNLSDVTISNVDIIHSRWNSNGSNPGLIGSNNLYDPSTQSTSATNHSTADTYSWASNITFSNIRSEGISGPLMRIYPLENMRDITISDIWIEEFGSCDGYEDIGISQSFMPMMTDGSGNNVTVDNFVIRNFVVGAEKVTSAGGVGNLAWDPEFDVIVQ